MESKGKIILWLTSGVLLQLIFVLTRVDELPFATAIFFGLVILVTRGRFLKKSMRRSGPAILIGMIATEAVVFAIIRALY